MPTKPTKAEIAASRKSIDPVGVMSATLAETPELADPLIARSAANGNNAVTRDAQGNIVVNSSTDSIHVIGDYITNYEPAANAFLHALVNRIGMTIITSKLYDNPWEFMKQGWLEFGETIEEIYVNIARPFGYSPSKAETDVFKREIPDVRAAFHRMNYQKFYKVTISNDQLRQAFLSWTGISDLIARIVDSLYTAANTDEYYMMKYMVANAIVRGYIQPAAIPAATKENSVDVATEFQAMSELLRFQSTKYTMSGVTTHTDFEDQYLIMDARFRATMNMNVLATAFNIEYRELMGRIVTVDDLASHDWERLTMLFTDPDTGEVDPNFHKFTEDEVATLNSCPAVLVSRTFLQIWDNFRNMTEQYNGQGLYWNYWLHLWKTFSISPFSQAVAYTSQAWSVTGVTVSPTTASVDKGQDVMLTAKVAGTGIINQNVTWSITGAVSSGTYVQGGKVHVASDETAASLTVTATSVGDPTKAGSATITVNGNTAA